jgi:hypothetical protein
VLIARNDLHQEDGGAENYPVTTPSEVPPATHDLQRNALGALVGGAATVVLYLAILGWNVAKEPRTCTGPHENGQVIGLALTLGAVVVVCASWRGEWGAAAAGSVAITVLFVVDVLTIDDPCNVASIWPVGAAFLLVGSVFGLGSVAALMSLARRLLRMSARRQGPSGTE